MSTRGIMGFRLDGKDKLAFNHWDSYPEGLGEQVVNQFNDLYKFFGLEFIKDRVRNLQLINPETYRKPTYDEEKKFEQYCDFRWGGSSDNWNCLLEKTQGELKATLECGIMIDNHEFIVNSLFCEWAYIINLDDNVIEAYKGFQKDPHDKGRYSALKHEYTGGDVYYGCALVATFSFDNLNASHFSTKLHELTDEKETVN